MREERGIFASGAGETVGAQNFRRVVSGVEADAEQVGLAVVSGIGAELVINGGEFMADARAEIRKRTARVDERKEQSLAAILMQGDALAVLVDEVEVRHVIAGSGDVHGRCGLGGGSFRMADDLDVFQPVLVIGGLNKNIGGDRVSGVKVIEGGGGFEGVGMVLGVQ